MKTINKLKLIAIGLLFLGITLISNAQISIGLSGGLGVPFGSMDNYIKGDYDAGYGGSVNGYYWLNNKMSLGLDVSYFSFAYSNIRDGNTVRYRSLPVALAFNYHFKDTGIKPFIGIESGVITNFFSWKLGDVELSYNRTGFLVSPVVGLAYGIKNKFDIIFSVKYMYGFTEKNNVVYDITGGTLEQQEKTNTYNTKFLNFNLGVSYKIGN